MKESGLATKAIFNALCKTTYTRAVEWFREHPEEEYAYWGKDEFLPGSASEQEKASFASRHPEVDDINDHTLIKLEGDTAVLWHFCPRLKEGIKDFYDSGYDVGKDCMWTVKPDGDNYKVFFKC